jgi:hypothetical protein
MYSSFYFILISLNVSSETQFAAISLRPNGDVSMTLDAESMNNAK